MKRIVFLDYVRVFACFLVMVVHASENFYGAAGATDMVGPQSYLGSEADRLWVAVYDGFSRMAVPLFMIVSAFLLAPMKKEQTMWQFYRQRAIRILPPFFIFMILYSTLPMLWGQINGETSFNDMSRILLNFPSLAGHLWFMYPLISLYLFIPIISPWLSKATAKEERFFIGLFLLSTCMPYLNRWFGEVWGQCFWNEYVVVLLRLLGIPCNGALYTCTSYMEPFQASHYRNYFNGGRCCMDDLFILYSGHSRRNSCYAGNRDRMGFLHHQLCASYGRYIPSFHMYKPAESATGYYRNIKAQLWYVPYAHILAWVMGNRVQA